MSPFGVEIDTKEQLNDAAPSWQTSRHSASTAHWCNVAVHLFLCLRIQGDVRSIAAKLLMLPLHVLSASLSLSRHQTLLIYIAYYLQTVVNA